MTDQKAYIVDVKGAFLHGDLDEVMYCKIPQGFEKHYDPKVWCWKLLKSAYGMKQAARTFWNKLLMIMKDMGCRRSLCDPCVYWKMTKKGLLVWVSWIDDMLCIGHPNEVDKSKMNS